jgi:hypothetical protein
MRGDLMLLGAGVRIRERLNFKRGSKRGKQFRIND